MRIPQPLISLGVVTLAALADPSFSQTPPPPPDAPAPLRPSGAVYSPQQFPSIRGEVERLSLTARGEIDGVILKDGTEVKTSPELSTQIAFAIRPGDGVTIHGLRAAALPLVRAVSITDDVTHRTVSDADVAASMNPAPPPVPPPALGASTETFGRVRMALHGPQGEVNGVLLENGVILRFPPEQPDQLVSFIQPRRSLVAEGISVSNALGTVVAVRQLGASRDQLLAVRAAPPQMDDRGPPGPPRRPPLPQGGPLAAPAPVPPDPALAPGRLPPSPPPVR
jgi:hypothetical protein